VCSIILKLLLLSFVVWLVVVVVLVAIFVVEPPPRSPRKPLVDIRDNVLLARSFVAGSALRQWSPWPIWIVLYFGHAFRIPGGMPRVVGARL